MPTSNPVFPEAPRIFIRRSTAIRYTAAISRTLSRTPNFYFSLPVRLKFAETLKIYLLSRLSQKIMPAVPIPDDVRRFILASITSVPYLEAMLLLRNEPEHAWDIKRLAQRLYVSDKTAGNLLSGLRTARVLIVTEQKPLQYRYHPDSDQLREMIDRLADTYSTNLVDVTDLIHSGTGTKTRQFTDIFKWRRNS